MRDSDRYRDEILQEVERSRPSGTLGFGSSDAEEMKRLGRVLKDAGIVLSQHKQEMTAEHKHECFERIQEVRDLHNSWWNEKKGRREHEMNKNASTLEAEIDSLSSGHWDIFERQHKEFWNHARQISHMFKTLKPLRSEDRERLWEKHNAACEKVKLAQESRRQERESYSRQHRSDIIREVESARPFSGLFFSPPDVEEMKRLGRVLKDAGQLLSKHKQEMLGEHKQECFERIKEVKHVHDLYWEEFTRHRSRKQEDFHQRVRANIDRNRERLRKAVDALRRAKSHADTLRDDIASAWSDDFRDRAYGWLSEEEDRMRDIEESINEIQNWIQEDEDKLR